MRNEDEKEKRKKRMKGDDDAKKLRQPLRVLRNPNANIQNSIGFDTFNDESTLPKNDRVLDEIADHGNTLNHERVRSSVSFRESNAKSMMNPNTEIETDVEEPYGQASKDATSGNTPPNEPLIVRSVDINKKPTSYVSAAGGAKKDQSNVQSNIRSLVAYKVFDGVNISIPRKVVEMLSVRFENTWYGYFIGKRMASLVVEYYVKNNWAKYRLKRIMIVES
nr:zinc knuckle CX2CX4HX4C [Tanacetum cinerariifolium]